MVYILQLISLVRAIDINVSFDTIYLMTDEHIIKGLTTHGSTITYEQAEDEDEEFDFGIVFYQNIKNHGIF
mgnify:CR=1 FL=1